ncbi:hypothetical protein FGG08_004413 [Glutinoglossum americanum]|uniref:Uncharacterized protein n=1 Tax=Glutinoglossum americanum TaxID=1670608 RepID=A0A9P8I994_9PEZI|nr:hypothetical protein FGG08_004413 [Glutinoglossum americanum]
MSAIIQSASPPAPLANRWGRELLIAEISFITLIWATALALLIRSYYNRFDTRERAGDLYLSQLSLIPPSLSRATSTSPIKTQEIASPKAQKAAPNILSCVMILCIAPLMHCLFVLAVAILEAGLPTMTHTGTRPIESAEHVIDLTWKVFVGMGIFLCLIAVAFRATLLSTYGPNALTKLATVLCHAGTAARINQNPNPESRIQAFRRTMTNTYHDFLRLRRRLDDSQTLPTTRVSESGCTERGAGHDAPNKTYLLTCINSGRFATRVYHTQLRDVKNDQQLLTRLRAEYQKIRGSALRSVFSLKDVNAINFIQFELRPNTLVDCLQKNQLPPAKNTEYIYAPRPPMVIPPIGERYLMHIYTHPCDAPTDTTCLDRLPKKYERLSLGLTSENRGWGIYFVEGVHLPKTLLVLVGLLSIGGVVFGVYWTVVERDIQGAWTAAGRNFLAVRDEEKFQSLVSILASSTKRLYELAPSGETADLASTLRALNLVVDGISGAFDFSRLVGVGDMR